MTTSRRDLLWAAGFAAIGGLAPRRAEADRLRILDGPSAAGPGGERSRELERLVQMLTLGDTSRRGALSIVWLHSPAAPAALDVATLDEAHAAGALVVSERERAVVPDLIVDNRGSRHVLLLAGEILLGGKQHRVLADDVLLPPLSGPRSIGVYCVEAGRWSGASARFESKGTFAPPRLRSELLDRADQKRVWGVVSQYAARAAAPSATQSYEAVVEQPEVREHVRRTEDDLDRPAGGAIGAAALVGVRLAGVDVFQSAALFGRLWPKLLRSYAVETYRHPSQPGADPKDHERRLRAAFEAIRGARGGFRRNAGEGATFEFRADARRGTALTFRDQVLHLAVV